MKKERKEARNLILMLSGAVFLGFIIVIALVYYFGSKSDQEDKAATENIESLFHE